MRNFLLGAIIAAATTMPIVTVRAAPVTAKSADSVVESIGVNLHLGYDDRVYNEFPAIKAGLQNLGIRHYRDGLENPAFKGHIKKRHNELGRAGIRGTFLAGLPIDQVLASANLVADSLEAFEGQNEILNIYVKWDDAKRDAARKHQDGALQSRQSLTQMARLDWRRQILRLGFFTAPQLALFDNPDSV